MKWDMSSAEKQKNNNENSGIFGINQTPMPNFNSLFLLNGNKISSIADVPKDCKILITSERDKFQGV